MFEFSSSKIVLIFLLFSSFFLAKAGENSFSYSAAIINSIKDEKNLRALSDSKNWDIGEIVPLLSQNLKIGVFAFVEIIDVKPVNSKYEVYLKLIRQSRKYMIQKGDYIKRIDLSKINDDYVGTTDLLIKKSTQNISSKYRPLVYQGVFIGETAQTMYKNEFLINVFGNILFGVTDKLYVNTFATLNVLGRPNFSFKYKFYDSESTTLSAGLNYVKLVKENESTLNLNFYWDSVSSDSLISHIYLGLGLIKWEGAVDASAIKAVGSSSFQTGYEIILNNWDRFLIGPSYNFEKKSLGGYLSYMMIWDRIHLQLSLNATDISKFRYDTKDGYFANFDLFWRF